MLVVNLYGCFIVCWIFFLVAYSDVTKVYDTRHVARKWLHNHVGCFFTGVSRFVGNVVEFPVFH